MARTSHHARYDFHNHGVYAIDQGGPYIDLYVEGAEYPFDTVNVWDYEKGERRIDDSQVKMEVLSHLNDA